MATKNFETDRYLPEEHPDYDPAKVVIVENPDVVNPKLITEDTVIDPEFVKMINEAAESDEGSITMTGDEFDEWLKNFQP